MPFDLFFKGLILGFSIAAPVGPIGVLCIRRTLADGRATGFVSGLGAATADAFYGAVAAFGLTLISDFLQGQTTWLKLIGGAFLVYLGIRTFVAKTVVQSQETKGSPTKLVGAYLSTLGLTITNPATILSFTVIFAGLVGGGNARGVESAGSLVSGVFGGSALWWLTLSVGVGLLRSRFDSRMMRWVNRGSGVILIVFGVIVIASLLA
jgi:threonine/homoserine/homoserine lactone efflux protein